MSLLLLFQPGVSSPTPTPTPAPVLQAELPQGGGAVFPHYLVRKKRIEQDEEDLIQIIAAVVPLLGRH